MTRNQAILKYLNEQREFLDTTVKENIEKYRKGDAEITVTDTNGNPIKNAEIKVKQVGHEFKFGANIFMLDEFESKEYNEKYKEIFASMFNMATVPFYWNTLEPEQGKPRYAADSPKIYRRPAPDLCIDFCEKHGIEPKLHCLAYENFYPAWMPEDEAAKPLYEKRFKEISERYSHRMNQYEVTNEILVSNNLKRKSPMLREIDGIKWFYEQADKYFPNNELTINECNVIYDGNFRDHFSGYFMQIQRLLDLGARIDRVGMQHHFFTGVKGKDATTEELEFEAKWWVNPKYMYRMLDTYSYFGKPIQFTEVTFPTLGDTAEDEEVQAEIIKAMYSTWFSHPSVDSVIYWNLPDGYAYSVAGWDENRTRGGLLHHDLTLKKSGEVLFNLINNEWSTKALIKTNENGECNFRGFYGKYEFEIKLGDKTYTKEISLTKNSPNNFNVVL